MFLRKVGIYLQVHTALQPRIPTSAFILVAGNSGKANFKQALKIRDAIHMLHNIPTVKCCDNYR
jgi:hypothetical protein